MEGVWELGGGESVGVRGAERVRTRGWRECES